MILILHYWLLLLLNDLVLLDVENPSTSPPRLNALNRGFHSFYAPCADHDHKPLPTFNTSHIPLDLGTAS